MTTSSEFGPYHRLYKSTGRMWGRPGKLVEEFLPSYAGCSSNCRVLDLGAGEGDNAFFLLEHGCHVDMVEISPIAAERIGRRTAMLPKDEQSRITVLTEPVGATPARPVYDVVIAYGLLHCFPDPATAGRAAQYCIDSMRPGAILILSVITNETELNDAHPELTTCYLPDEPTLLIWFECLEQVHLERATVAERHGGGPWHEHALIRAAFRKPAA